MNSKRTIEEIITDSANLLGQFILNAKTIFLLLVENEGTIRFCNDAFLSLLKQSNPIQNKQNLWTFLTDSDSSLIRQRIQEGENNTERILLNFVNADHIPFTLDCILDIQSDHFTIIGEIPKKHETMLEEELLRLNNELALLTRENVKKKRALEKTLTELKQAQTMLIHQEKMASLGQMTAGIAHEINNPIAFVKNNQESLQRDFEDLLGFIHSIEESLLQISTLSSNINHIISTKADEIDLEYLIQNIPKKLHANLKGLDRVKEIVTNLRNFSRLDEGDFKWCSITEGIEATILFLTPLIKKHHVQIETDYQLSEPVYCSPGALNQAVSNIIANAIQASPSDEIVRVSTRKEATNAIIRIEDHGPGIPEELHWKVFEPFFTTKPVGSGTGLGLSIAHQIVHSHQGEIRIDTPPKGGTTFIIQFPTYQEKSSL